MYTSAGEHMWSGLSCLYPYQMLNNKVSSIPVSVLAWKDKTHSEGPSITSTDSRELDLNFIDLLQLFW